MATRVKTGKSGPTFVSKSDWARSLLKEGKTIAEITRTIPNMGYAFAYGIAKRTPHPDGGSYADHAANRRESKQVVTTDGKVHVRIVDSNGTYTGTVIVDTLTGKTTRSK